MLASLIVADGDIQQAASDGEEGIRGYRYRYRYPGRGDDESFPFKGARAQLPPLGMHGLARGNVDPRPPGQAARNIHKYTFVHR